MNSDQALHHLNEVRRNVDGEIAEYVDTIAQLVLLNQDIDNPMLGAKVTVFTRPPTDQHRVPASEVPEDITPESEGVTGYNEYEKDGEEMVFYTVKQRAGDPDVYPVEGIVIEGNIAENAPDGQLWDPNKREYTTRDDYPLGTVNTVVPEGWESGGEDALFSEGYCSSTVDQSSLVPDGRSQSDTACYVPGWGVAREFHLDAE